MIARLTVVALGVAASLLVLGAVPTLLMAADDPEAAAIEVVSRSDGGQPCPRVERVGGGQVKGGCIVRVIQDPIVYMSVLSMVGVAPFAPCGFRFEMRVDARGRFAIDDARITGISPCNDVRPCFGESYEDTVPWRGRLERGDGGSLVARIGMCLDTCMGRFSGPVELGLKRQAEGWRMTADRATVGTSGWELDGEWKVDAHGVDFGIGGSGG